VGWANHLAKKLSWSFSKIILFFRSERLNRLSRGPGISLTQVVEFSMLMYLFSFLSLALHFSHTPSSHVSSIKRPSVMSKSFRKTQLLILFEMHKHHWKCFSTLFVFNYFRCSYTVICVCFFYFCDNFLTNIFQCCLYFINVVVHIVISVFYFYFCDKFLIHVYYLVHAGLPWLFCDNYGASWLLKVSKTDVWVSSSLFHPWWWNDCW